MLRHICGASGPTIEELRAAPHDERATTLFDGCDLQRFGVVERDAFLRQEDPRLLPFALHEWLVRDLVPPEQARVIASAVNLIDWPDYARTDIELPRVPTAPASSSARGGKLLTVGKRTIWAEERTVERGARHEEDALTYFEDLLAAALLDELADDLARSIAHDPSASRRLVIAADRTLLHRTLMVALSTGERVGFNEFMLVAERSPLEPVLLPVRPPALEGTPGPALRVHIDATGFSIEGAGGATTRLDHPTGASWNFTALEERVMMARDKRRAVLSVDDEITVETVVRTLVALQGPTCASSGACRISEVVLQRAAEEVQAPEGLFGVPGLTREMLEQGSME